MVTAVGEGVDLAIGGRVMCVTAFWTGPRFVRRGVSASRPTRVSRARRPDRRRGRRVLDPAPHRRGSGSSIAVASRPAMAGRARRGRRQRHRGRATRTRARRAGHRRRERRGARRRSAASSAPTSTINHRDGPLARCAPRRAPAGEGVDLIYDPVGGAIAEDAAGALARNGRLLAVGFASGRWPKLAAHDLVIANTSLVGVFAGGYSRAELDDIHANLAGLVARRPAAQRGDRRGHVRRAARRAPTHGRPSASSASW